MLSDSTALPQEIIQENSLEHLMHQMEHQLENSSLDYILTNQMEDMITFSLVVMVMRKLRQLKKLTLKRLKNLSTARKVVLELQVLIAEKIQDQSVKTIKFQRALMKLLVRK